MGRTAGSKNKPKQVEEQNKTPVGEVSFMPPDIPIEKFYNITKVPGGIANCAVEELTIKGNAILSRKFVSDRDNRIGTESRLMVIIQRNSK